MNEYIYILESKLNERINKNIKPNNNLQQVEMVIQIRVCLRTVYSPFSISEAASFITPTSDVSKLRVRRLPPRILTVEVNKRLVLCHLRPFSTSVYNRS
jgi:hypothetical protein